jgi:hypothetical protein
MSAWERASRRSEADVAMEGARESVIFPAKLIISKAGLGWSEKKGTMKMVARGRVWLGADKVLGVHHISY